MAGRGRRIALALATALTLAVIAAPSARAALPAGLVGYWTFDAGTGTVAADAATPAHPLTLGGGAGWGPGIVGPSALALDGRGESASAAGPVLSTTGSYTVTAWVRPGSVAGTQTYVSQDGTQVSGFFLQLHDGEFALSVPAADATSAPVTVAASTAIIPQPGEWYLLAGVVDASAQTVSLYVNGSLQATVPEPAPWAAGGDFAVGRSLWGGVHRDFVRGEVDDVRAYDTALGAGSIVALAGPGGLTVDGDAPGARTRPTQFGEFLEEISHSGDGGLYAEMIRNRDLKESPTLPVGYSATGAAAPALTLTRADPLTPQSPVSMALAVPAGASGTAGVANGGWWGMAVQPSTAYEVSFYARATGPATGAPITVSLQSDSGRVWASAPVAAPGTGWKRYFATITTPAGIPPSLTNQFVISVNGARAAGGTDYLTLVSVFPPTYDHLRDGFRIDLMQKLAALRPGYLRIPGGNYLEGETLATRFNWMRTLGPIEGRPGHENSAWQYWSQDGMGLLEYLELAQELHARPILDVFAGYTLNGTVVPRDQLAPYVRSAVDEIQYATGPTTSYWGHQRALDGHPAPFPVNMVEIGNEDFFDASGSYGLYRYPMFYDAIHRAFPRIRLIASEPVTSRPVFAVDRHFYSRDPQTFARDAHLFDSFSPRGAKVLVGEYGAVQGSPTGDVADAVGEAAFLTGTIRDASVVLGASYAPLLVNVNDPSWPTSLIGFNALNSYVSPSYEVQQMLADHLGTRVVGTSLAGSTGTLFQVATERPGQVDLVVVNDGSAAASLPITLTGLGAGVTRGTATVLGGAPGAANSILDPYAVVPQTYRLGRLGPQFTGQFPADSVNVLALDVPSATG